MNPDFQNRRENLRKTLRDRSCPNFLVTNIINVGYLTGFSGSSAYLLVTPNEEILLSDGRYTEQIASECPDLNVEIRPIDSTMLKLLAAVVTKSSIDSMLIESTTMTRAFSNQLESLLSNVELIDSEGIVEQLRSIKDDFELATIRQSIAINEQVFRDFTANLSRHQTERQIGFDLEHQMRAKGAEKCSFEPIVAAGPSSALAHYHGGETAIGGEVFLLLDWGTQLRGYASDLTRMVYWGDIDSQMVKIHEIVLAAQTAAIESVRAGATLQDIDHAARSVISEAGFGDNFNHGLGHGIGLEIHENPFLSPAFSGQLAANMVITIEPGIYLSGVGGVRLEDDILVTEDGFEILSSLPKSFEASQFEMG